MVSLLPLAEINESGVRFKSPYNAKFSKSLPFHLRVVFY